MNPRTRPSSVRSPIIVDDDGPSVYVSTRKPQEDPVRAPSAFVTASAQLAINDAKKNKTTASTTSRQPGLSSRPSAKFVPPFKKDNAETQPLGDDGEKGMRNIDPKMVELITNEIMDHGPVVEWDDIAGLEFAKQTIQEIVIWPMLRPDLFQGLRAMPKGLLLFGPPGTGKTLIAKCISNNASSTFFSISASSLTSKWIGDGEKMVRALFAVARTHMPAVIFIDEVDSLLSQRSETEHESSRRLKTEFLIQLDGATTQSDERLLIVGATNRPQELDEAARRRFVKRLYIPLPDSGARHHIINRLLQGQKSALSTTEIAEIVERTKGYSGSDMSYLCKEAALGPMRSIRDIRNVSVDQVRPINFSDFEKALLQVRASVAPRDLKLYLDWNAQFGSAELAAEIDS